MASHNMLTKLAMAYCHANDCTADEAREWAQQWKRTPDRIVLLKIRNLRIGDREALPLPEHEYRDGADCTVIALSLLANIPYADAWLHLKRAGRKTNRGATRYIQRQAAKAAGLVLVGEKPKSRTLRTLVREFPKGRYYVHVRGHVVAMIDGVINDSQGANMRRLRKVMRVTEEKKS